MSKIISANKLNRLYQEGVKPVERRVTTVEGQVATIDSKLTQEIVDRENNISVLNSRMNTFTSLTEGSTTGDAELADIRVDINGKTHGTAGEAVRGQISQLSNEITVLNEVYNLLEVNLYTGILHDNQYRQYNLGYLIPVNGYGCTDLIEVLPTTKYHTNATEPHVCYFDKNQNFISGTLDKEFTTPNNCKYLTLSVRNTQENIFLYMGDSENAIITESRSNKMNELEKNSVELDKINSLLRFNLYTGILYENKYRPYNFGFLADVDGFGCTDFISVLPNEKYYTNANGVQVCYFDYKQNFISGTLSNEFTTPNNCRFVALSVPSTQENIMFYRGGKVNTSAIPLELGDSLIVEKVVNLIGQDTKKVVTVGEGKQYESILEALMTEGTNTIFKLSIGTFDILEEYNNYFGEDFFVNYEGYNVSSIILEHAGLPLKKGCELHGEANTVLKFNYTGDNEKVKSRFSVIAMTLDNVIKDIKISITDNCCQYHIHDDFAILTGTYNQGTNIIENVIFEGNPNQYGAIGGGFGLRCKYLIQNCVFLNTEKPSIMYHNNFSALAENKITIKDCYALSNIIVNQYGNSTKKSVAIISGCKAKSISKGTLDDAQENIDLYQWNNTVGES